MQLEVTEHTVRLPLTRVWYVLTKVLPHSLSLAREATPRDAAGAPSLP